MSKPHVVILAAGKGNRMKSSLPKVLHPVLFSPMIHHVIETSLKLDHSSITVVLGHQGEQVKKACSKYQSVQYAWQKEQLGTADALLATREHFKGVKGNILVLSGDVILLRQETLQCLLEQHQSTKSSCTLMTATLLDPSGYGRILRNNQAITGIREQVDCSEAETKIDEVNCGIYSFDAELLFNALDSVGNSNNQGEYYLTDVVRVFLDKNLKVSTFKNLNPDETLGINDRVSLAKVESYLSAKINEKWMKEGVTIHNPNTVVIDSATRLEPDTVIEGGCTLVNTKVGANSCIEANSRIFSTEVGRHCFIKQGSYIEESKIQDACTVGPYARLRAGSVLHADVKIGNFVEIKKSTLQKGTKASHLSYIGDASIGEGVNLGCGFITCNYDGQKKNETVIKDHVFVGSDSQTVAPVTIGEGSYVASGTTITEDVPPNSLVLSRGRQITKPHYKKK